VVRDHQLEGAPPSSAEPRGWGISVSRSGDIHLSVVNVSHSDPVLLPRGVRIVLEVDGKQHYAEGDTASHPSSIRRWFRRTAGSSFAAMRSAALVDTS
jgi:hypothetical protein